MRRIPVLAAVMLITFPCAAWAQASHPLKVQVSYDTTDAISSAVGSILIQKIAAYPKVFTLSKGQEDKDMSVITDCVRETSNDPYSCYYVAHELLGSIQSLLGGGIIVKKSADEAAAALLMSMAQDVVERWNNTNRSMLISELETCLLLTESNCAVPPPLVSELKVKSINMSQYMRSGGLKP